MDLSVIWTKMRGIHGIKTGMNLLKIIVFPQIKRKTDGIDPTSTATETKQKPTLNTILRMWLHKRWRNVTVFRDVTPCTNIPEEHTTSKFKAEASSAKKIK